VIHEVPISLAFFEQQLLLRLVQPAERPKLDQELLDARVLRFGFADFFLRFGRVA